MLIPAASLAIPSGFGLAVLNSMVPFPNLHWAVPVSVVVLPVLLYAGVLLTLTQRTAPIFAGAWRFSLVHLWIYGVTRALLDPFDRGATLTIDRMLLNTFGLAIVATVVASTVVLINWGVRRCWLVLVEQTGTLCWKCGYDSGSPAISRCPECGSTIDLRRFRHQPVISSARWLAQRSRALFAVATLGAVIGGAIIMRAQGTVNALRFGSRFYGSPKSTWVGLPRNMITGWIPDPVRTGTQAAIPCLGASMKLRERPELIAHINYLPVAHGGTVAMRIEIMRDPAVRQPLAPPGMASVFCHLGRVHTEEVVDRGVSESSLGAMIASLDQSARRSIIGSAGPMEFDAEPYFSDGQ